MWPSKESGDMLNIKELRFWIIVQRSAILYPIYTVWLMVWLYCWKDYTGKWM